MAASARWPCAAQSLGERRVYPLRSAIGLAPLEVLSVADELHPELAPGSVEVRLRAAEPSFVIVGVAAAPPDLVPPPAPAGTTAG